VAYFGNLYTTIVSIKKVAPSHRRDGLNGSANRPALQSHIGRSDRDPSAPRTCSSDAPIWSVKKGSSTDLMVERLHDNVDADLHGMRTRKDGATGIDGATAQDYEANLEANLRGLLERIKSGRYEAPPVRRTYIPKADGSQRPIGIPTVHA
jgi:hypothetical protein